MYKSFTSVYEIKIKGGSGGGGGKIKKKINKCPTPDNGRSLKPWQQGLSLQNRYFLEDILFFLAKNKEICLKVKLSVQWITLPWYYFNCMPNTIELFTMIKTKKVQTKHIYHIPGPSRKTPKNIPRYRQTDRLCYLLSELVPWVPSKPRRAVVRR